MWWRTSHLIKMDSPWMISNEQDPNALKRHLCGGWNLQISVSKKKWRTASSSYPWRISVIVHSSTLLNRRIPWIRIRGGKNNKKSFPTRFDFDYPPLLRSYGSEVETYSACNHKLTSGKLCLWKIRRTFFLCRGSRGRIKLISDGLLATWVHYLLLSLIIHCGSFLSWVSSLLNSISFKHYLHLQWIPSPRKCECRYIMPKKSYCASGICQNN